VPLQELPALQADGSAEIASAATRRGAATCGEPPVGIGLTDRITPQLGAAVPSLAKKGKAEGSIGAPAEQERAPGRTVVTVGSDP